MLDITIPQIDVQLNQCIVSDHKFKKSLSKEIFVFGSMNVNNFHDIESCDYQLIVMFSLIELTGSNVALLLIDYDKKMFDPIKQHNMSLVSKIHGVTLINKICHYWETIQ